jgi:hypothetical protein
MAVVAAAQASPPNAYAREAMLIHYRYLMRCMCQLSIITQCGAVVLAGDNQVQRNTDNNKRKRRNGVLIGCGVVVGE